MADPVSLAITVALNAATMALTMMNKVEGPRLDDLTVTTADYGTPLVQIYGTRRVECPCFYAEKIREEKHKVKGKTGKYAEYKYFGTWANVIADCMNPLGALTDVLKIFLDRRLMYDKSAIGPISIVGFFKSNSGDGLKIGKNCRIYLGTETQAPDPRMVAKIEAKEGPGRCPAYLGLAYVMFEEVALEKFGNRLPQCSAVAMRAPPVDLFPFERRETPRGLENGRFTNDFRILVVAASTLCDVWDVANRQLVYSGNLSAGASGPLGLINGASFYTTIGSPGFPQLFIQSVYGGASLVTDRSDFIVGGCEYISGGVYIYMFGEISDGYGILSADEFGLIMKAIPGFDFVVTHMFPDADGNVVFAGWNRNTGGTNEIVINGTHIASPTSGPTAGYDTGNGTYCISQQSSLYLIDKESLTIVASVDTGWPLLDRDIMANLRPGFDTIWIGNREFDTTDLSLVREVDFNDWVGAGGATQTFYDPINHALLSVEHFADFLDWRFLDRRDPTGFPLGEICEDVALQCGYRAGEFDFSDLDQVVRGYGFTQGAGKDVVGPLLEIHDSDIRPHGFIQQGLKRGQPLTGGAISSEFMVPESRGDDAASSPLYRIPMTAETDLPRRVWATFADPNMEEQPNTAIVQRNSASVRTDREVSFDLGTLSIEPDDIQPMLERALRRYWVGATKPECRLTPLELRTEPGDVRHVIFDGDRMRCRATRTRIRANRVIDTEWEVDGETQLNPPDWELDDASPLTQLFNSPGGTTNGRDPDGILVAQETTGIVFDTPLLTDAHDQAAPFVYLAAGPEFDGFWPGCGVFQNDTDGSADSYLAGWDSFPSDMITIQGVTTGTLPDAATDVIDYGSEIEVVIVAGGALESVTEDDVLNDQSVNLALIGDELVQFIDADEIDTNRWRLSGFVRGQRGTEYAVAGHDDAEKFVLIGSAVKKHDLGASEIGDTDYYKFSTLGDNLDSVEMIAVDFVANAHKPLSPCHLALQRQTNNDWLISWQRRTRIGGSTLNGQDVPLGETSELYRVKIMDGSDVFKTYESTEEQYLYTEAQQVIDWGFSPSTLVVEVVQVSPALNIESRPAGPLSSSANPHSGTAPNQVGDQATSTGATVEVTLPPYDVGDMMFIHVAQVSFGSFGPDNTPPAGWELIHSDTTHDPYQIVYGREMDGTEDPTVTVTVNGQAVNRLNIATAFALRGAQAGLTVEAQTQNNGSGPGGSGSIAMVSPVVTTLGTNRRVFNCLAAARGADDTQTESADTWTDLFWSGTIQVSYHMDTTVSYRDAGSAGAQPAETRHQTDGVGLFWTYISFAVIMA